MMFAIPHMVPKKNTTWQWVCAAGLLVSFCSGSLAKDLCQGCGHLRALIWAGIMGAHPRQCSRYTALQQHIHHQWMWDPPETDPDPSRIWSPWAEAVACCSTSTMASRTNSSLFHTAKQISCRNHRSYLYWKLVRMLLNLQPTACSCYGTTALWWHLITYFVKSWWTL